MRVMRTFRPVIKILSFLLIFISLFMLVPVLTLINGDHQDWRAFLISAAITFGSGVVGAFIGRGDIHFLRQKQMFLLTVLAWFVIGFYGSLPLILSNYHLSVTDAVFESVSGITTTGSTILVGLDHMPSDILLWRSLLQWMGGIGFIGMAVAILPFLRVGGMRLFSTESSEWSEKAVPRTAVLAKGLVMVYLMISSLCALCYWLGGMSFFNAINHAMTTMATGGYSTSDASFGQFHSDYLMWVSIVFMAIASMPFFLFLRMVHGQYWAPWRDSQVRFFVKFLLITSLVLGVRHAWAAHIDFWQAFTQAAFNITSIVSTTGYASQDYTQWSAFAVALFFFLAFVGGCSGSTAGGLKIFRFQLSLMLLKEQIVRLMHPRAVFSRRYNGRIIGDDIIAASVAFSFIYLATTALMTLLMSLQGVDLVTAVTGAITALGNVGPGLGSIIGPAGNFKSLPDGAKWVLSIGMILGRLELLSVLVVLSPSFWRK